MCDSISMHYICNVWGFLPEQDLALIRCFPDNNGTLHQYRDKILSCSSIGGWLRSKGLFPYTYYVEFELYSKDEFVAQRDRMTQEFLEQLDSIDSVEGHLHSIPGCGIFQKEPKALKPTWLELFEHVQFVRYWNFIAQGLKEIAQKKREEQQRQKLLRKAQRAEEDELEEFEEGEEEEDEGEEDCLGG